MTVVLSSHILGEIQLICDSVTIISLGRRVAAGPVAEVLAAALRPAACGCGWSRGADLPTAAEVLRAAGAQVTSQPDHLLVDRRGQARRWITRMLAEQRALRQRAGPGRGRPGERLPRADRHRAGRRAQTPPGRPVRDGARRRPREGGAVSLTRRRRAGSTKRRFTRLVLVLAPARAGARSRSAFIVANQKVGPDQVAAAEAEAQRQLRGGRALRTSRMVTRLRGGEGARRGRSAVYPADCAQDWLRAARASSSTRVATCPTSFDFRDEFGASSR